MDQGYIRPLKRTLAYTLAIVLVPLLAGVVGAGARTVSALRTDTNPPPFTGELPAPPPHDPARPTAVVVAANSGTEGSDFLAPYAVLGTSGAFNLYAVAPSAASPTSSQAAPWCGGSMLCHITRSPSMTPPSAAPPT